MKANKTKQDENQAFIEKIKSISIMGGTKGGGKKPVECPDCGKELHPVAVIPLGIFSTGYRHPRKLPTDEQSFAA